MQFRSTWTEEEKNAVTVLFHAGKTATEAADELKREFKKPITRNAVIGQWTRIGLRREHDPSGNNERRKRAYAARDQKQAAVGMIQRIKRSSTSSIGQRIASAARQRERVRAAAFDELMQEAANRRVERGESEPVDTRTEFDIRTKHACDLLGLTNTTCRWPCCDPGHSDFFFCGIPEANCDLGRPYCAGHTRIAWG